MVNSGRQPQAPAPKRLQGLPFFQFRRPGRGRQRGEALGDLTERRILRFAPSALAVWLAAGLTAALLSIQLAVSEEADGQDPFVLAYAGPQGLPAGQAPTVPVIARDAITFQVQPGDTLGNLFATAGIEPAEADRAVAAIRKVFDPRNLRVGQELTVGFLREGSGDGRPLLRIATIWLEADSYIEVIRLGDGGFIARRTSQSSLEDRIFDTDNLTRIVVKSGDTLDALLRGAGVDALVADEAVRALRSLFNPRKLAVGQELFLSLDPRGGGLLGMSLKISENKFATVLRGAEGHYSALRTNGPALPGGGATEAEPRLAAAAEAGASEVRDVVPAPGLSISGLWQTVVARITNLGAEPGSGASPIRSGKAPDGEHVEAIDKGDTLMAALLRAGTSSEEAQDAVEAFRTVYDPRKIRAGQALKLSFAADEDGKTRLASLSLDLSPEHAVIVALAGDGRFRAEEVQRPVEIEKTRATATITSSLYEAAADAGLPVSVLMDLIRVFSYDVDFQRDIQKDDSFEILFERVYTTSGELVREGPILYASLALGGKKLELFRFETADGRADYFDATGQSVRKALLRTPIDGARLSSTYGMRKDPILGYSKMHRGTDFAAPKGTPIVAAGDGVIEMIGRNGGYGKYVRIRHNGDYATAYAHLSAFAKGLKKGSRVTQGEVIGYVGATGRATGPHLHYEVLVDGEQVNPLSVKLPTGEKLAGAELARFTKERTRILAELDNLPALTRIAAAGTN